MFELIHCCTIWPEILGWYKHVTRSAVQYLDMLSLLLRYLREYRILTLIKHFTSMQTDRPQITSTQASSSLVQPQLQQMSRRTFHACSLVTNSCRVSKKTQPARLDDLPGNQKEMKVITFF
jgi:hypothetical protein